MIEGIARKERSVSEQENQQLVEEALDAFNAQDLDRVLGFVDPAIRLESSGLTEPIVGRDAYRQALQERIDAFPDGRIEIEQVIASGNTVVVRQRFTGTQRGEFQGLAPTNRSVDVLSCSVIEIENGRAVRQYLYSDSAVLQQQLGVEIASTTTQASS